MGGEPFRPQRPRGCPGGLPPGLGHSVRGGGPGLRGATASKGDPGGLPPGLGHSIRGGVRASRGACPRFRP